MYALSENKTRIDALTKGHKHYYSGVPCKHGHMANRFASSGACTYCVNPRKAYLASKLPEGMVARIDVILDAPLNPERLAELKGLLTGWARHKVKEWTSEDADKAT